MVPRWSWGQSHCVCVFTWLLSFPCSQAHSCVWSQTPWTCFDVGPFVLWGTGVQTSSSERCCGNVEACCPFRCGSHCRGHPLRCRGRQKLWCEDMKYVHEICVAIQTFRLCSQRSIKWKRLVAKTLSWQSAFRQPVKHAWLKSSL